MLNTAYLQRYSKTNSHKTVELGKNGYEKRLELYMKSPSFAYSSMREYTDESWGKPIDIKVISIATDVNSTVEFLELHGDELFVGFEAFYLTHF